MNGRRGDQVIVIEDEDERLGCGDVVDQGRQKHLWRRWLGDLHHRLGTLADARINPL